MKKTGPTRLFYREQEPKAQYRLLGYASGLPRAVKPMQKPMRPPFEIVVPVYPLVARLKDIESFRSKRKKIDWKLELSDKRTRVYWEAKVTSISIKPKVKRLIEADIGMLRLGELFWKLPK